MQEVLKSLEIGFHVVEFVLPLDSDLPPAKFECDHHFHMGEAYLAGNQARLAINRFNQALASFKGKSKYQYFLIAVKLALAESYAAIDVKDWDNAIKYLDQILIEYPNEGRAHAIKARVFLRQGNLIEAYESAMKALKNNEYHFEAACYLALIGFSIAKAENNLVDMAKDIENFKIAQSLYPGSNSLAKLIKICEE